MVRLRGARRGACSFSQPQVSLMVALITMQTASCFTASGPTMKRHLINMASYHARTPMALESRQNAESTAEGERAA